MNRWSALAILLIFAGALVFRLPRLDIRPLHNDEAVNATKVADLWEHHRYAYDPDEYHGPTLHYATLPFLWLSGARNSGDLPDRVLRYAPVAFGAALILLLFLFRDAFGGPHALVWSALFLAISPAMVFYSRYFIHEMLLVFFTALALGAGWRYARNPRPLWAALTGLSVGLMFATKETFVLTVAAAAAALVLTAGSPLRFVKGRDAALALFAALAVWLLFFSSFFTHFAGLVDSVRTYFPWLKRAAGHSPHLHPWYFYFERLGWFHPATGPFFTELLLLGLGAIGAIFAFSRKDLVFGRFLVFYTSILAAIYSAISYKTPWCLLSFFFGIILLAGIGAASLIERLQLRLLRLAVIVVLLAGSAQLATQAWRASYPYSSDRRNPYVYAQTVPDTLNLARRIEAVARVSPNGYSTVVKVIAPEGDYWPLPWYLRRFRNVGWYEQMPEDPFAPIIVVSSKLDARLDEKSGRKWVMTGLSEMRPGQFFELYVELQLWTRHVETLPPSND